jgi:hypothetical protein
MSDDARRAAERRWRETSAVDDGRRFLAHLLRAGRDEVEALRVRLAIGDLHPERALLAAHVGHAPARAALADRAPTGATSLAAWGERLFDFGQAACVRAALAAGRVALRALDDGAGDEAARAALAAAEGWLACPCPLHYDEGERWNQRRGTVPEWAWQAVTAAHCPPRTCWHHVEALRSAAAAVGEEQVRAAVLEALLPWALPAEGAARPLERPVSGRG